MEESSSVTASFESLDPREFHEKHFRQNEHSDGRELGEYRPCSLQLGVVSSAHGSAMTKQGNTTIMASVKAELCQPAPDRQTRGFMVINLDGSVANLSESQQAQLAEYQNVINQMAERDTFVSLESLCIKSGRLAWVLYCDLMCLDVDGSVLDVGITALMAALYDTKLPSVTFPEEEKSASTNDQDSIIEEDKQRVEPIIDLSKNIPLKIDVFPVVSTYSCYADQMDKMQLVADPTRSEDEWILGGKLSIGVLVRKSDQNLCGVWFFGKNSSEGCDSLKSATVASVLLSEPLFNQAVLIARKRHVQVVSLIKEASNF